MNERPVILIVDDEKNTREGLQKSFRHKYDILLADSAEQGLEALRGHAVDVILVDLRMPGMDGMAFLRRVTASENPPLVILFTAYGTLQIADEALRQGAYEYLAKPLNLDNLEMVIERGLESRRLRAENVRLRQELDEAVGLTSLVGNSRAMQAVFDSVRQVAGARSTVLLTGESGTGKELIAHAIHRLSPRAGNPFVVVHCASLNPNLLESELFGHEKGAYTGAHERQAGRFETAEGGTLFLDEIGELDGATQIKLLRILETRSFERVGGNTPIDVDVRLLAATNRNLRALVDEGRFREDLFYRLNVVNIHLPPLRERTDDIPLLLAHFLRQFAAENGRTVNGFSSEALKLLTGYAWPGNVRELRNCVERMVVMSRGTTLTLGDVPPDLRSAAAHPPGAGSPGAAPAGLDLNANERELIRRALEKTHSNRTLAAKTLGISRRTLHRKLKAYGLEDH